jgi:hypothetical protein
MKNVTVSAKFENVVGRQMLTPTTLFFVPEDATFQMITSPGYELIIFILNIKANGSTPQRKVHSNRFIS